jgi:hypothetical protein
MISYTLRKYLLFFYPIFLSILFGLLIYVAASLYRHEMGVIDDGIYNKLLNWSENFKKIEGGFAYSGDTSFFTMSSPKEFDEETLEFSIKFKDEQIVDQVAVIYIDVTQINDKGRPEGIFNDFYRPQHGINRFKISKQKLPKGCKMMIGFFWKSEWGLVVPPNYEKITYNISQ